MTCALVVGGARRSFVGAGEHVADLVSGEAAGGGAVVVDGEADEAGGEYPSATDLAGVMSWGSTSCGCRSRSVT